MKNKFYLEYDQMIKNYQISCIGEFNVSASLGYLKNLDNHKIWKDSSIICYFLMLDWLKENHPEILI
jgi:hypothetical protein